MLYVATARALFVAAGLVLFLGGAAVVYKAIAHVQDRVTIWLHPWTDERVYCALNGQLEYRQDCASYQLVKSLYSIANGGFGGTGLGKGRSPRSTARSSSPTSTPTSSTPRSRRSSG